MSDVVRDMHTTSGLLEDRSPAEVGLAEAADVGARYVMQLAPRGPQGAAVRQLDRNRPVVHRPRHARARQPAALPERRRLVDEGTGPALVPAGYFASPDKNGGAPGAGRRQSSPCASCATTGTPCSCRSLGRTRRPRGRSPRGTPTRGQARRARKRQPDDLQARLQRSAHPVRYTLFSLPVKAHGGCSSAGRAPGCGPGGRGFKPHHSPQVCAVQEVSPARAGPPFCVPDLWSGVERGFLLVVRPPWAALPKAIESSVTESCLSQRATTAGGTPSRSRG